MEKKYVYYCDDCKCFVKGNHRCQQWETVHIIPKDAIDKLHTIDKLLETAHNSDCAKCNQPKPSLCEKRKTVAYCTHDEDCIYKHFT